MTDENRAWREWRWSDGRWKETDKGLVLDAELLSILTEDEEE